VRVVLPWCNFSSLIVAAYLVLTSNYCALRCSRNSSLSLVLWYLRRRAFTLFRRTVSSADHQWTDLCVDAVFVTREILKELLQAKSKTSWNSSTILSMTVSFSTLVHNVSSNISVPPATSVSQSFCSASRIVGFAGISLHPLLWSYTSLLN